MTVLTRQQCREVDRSAIEGLQIPSIVLMENAARGTVDVLLEGDPNCRHATILCGKGNNGGDGLAIARHLLIRGVAVQVVLFTAGADLTGDALRNYTILRRSHVPILEIPRPEDAEKSLGRLTLQSDWIVDALLGTGATGQLRAPFDVAIAWINNRAARRLAVDVPSGLDCDTGQPAATTVRADVTCTFVAEKVGFESPNAQEYLGQVHVVSIGIVPEALEQLLK